MKIVSLLPSASEILVGLDLLDNIVGISHECNFPSSLNNIPKITYSDIPKSTNQKKPNQRVGPSLFFFALTEIKINRRKESIRRFKGSKKKLNIFEKIKNK